MLKKIVIIGPESTGKSTLCQQLARHYSGRFQTDWCPEFAREYLLEHGMKYSYEDLLTIAKGQLELEDQRVKQLEQKAGGQDALIFIDTDMMVMKVWCEFVFGKCHAFILDQLASRQYDYYFLANTDIPWVKDELREYPDPHTRQQLFNMYHDLLVNQDTLWTVVSGTEAVRLKTAVATVDDFLN